VLSFVERSERRSLLLKPVLPIVIGASTTQLLRNASYALTFPAGSELVLSKTDHEANIASWVALAARQNLVIKWWIPKNTSNPKLLPAELKELLSAKTVLVACTHASNILGTINDVKSIVQAVREGPNRDTLVCVDAVAYMPHRMVNVKDLGVDFYVFSWYKVGLPNSFMGHILR
jgi:selenocysteine lyase/cysteine desulfurase